MWCVWWRKKNVLEIFFFFFWECDRLYVGREKVHEKKITCFWVLNNTRCVLASAWDWDKYHGGQPFLCNNHQATVDDVLFFRKGLPCAWNKKKFSKRVQKKNLSTKKKEHVSYHFALPSDSYFHGSHLCGVESCETYLGFSPVTTETNL